MQDCDEPDCQHISEVINAAIDPSAQPCNDFFKFSCGKNKNKDSQLNKIQENFEEKILKLLSQTLTGSEEKWEKNVRYTTIKI